MHMCWAFYIHIPFILTVTTSILQMGKLRLDQGQT